MLANERDISGAFHSQETGSRAAVMAYTLYRSPLYCWEREKFEAIQMEPYMQLPAVSSRTP